MHEVPASIACQPRPKAPIHLVRWNRAWLYYFEDLACWKAMKVDCLLDGIKEEGSP